MQYISRLRESSIENLQQKCFWMNEYPYKSCAASRCWLIAAAKKKKKPFGLMFHSLLAGTTVCTSLSCIEVAARWSFLSEKSKACYGLLVLPLIQTDFLKPRLLIRPRRDWSENVGGSYDPASLRSYASVQCDLELTAAHSLVLGALAFVFCPESWTSLWASCEIKVQLQGECCCSRRNHWSVCTGWSASSSSCEKKQL